MRSIGGCGIVALGLALCGLGAARAADAQRAAPAARRWMRGSWRLVGGVTRPDYLGKPDLLAVDSTTIYVYDREGSLKAFGMDGTPRWRFAGAGTGDTHVTGLAIDARHRVWLAQPDVGRITIVNPDGTLADTVGVRGVLRIAPLPDGSFWATTVYSAVPQHFDARGRHLQALRLPVEIARRHALQTFAMIERTNDGTVAVSYLWSSRFVIAAHDGSVVRVRQGVEPIAFAPVIDTVILQGGRRVPVQYMAHGSRTATLDASVDRGVLYELFTNHEGDRSVFQRTLDAYAVATGRYVGSYRLAEDAALAQVRDRRFVVVTQSDRPVVHVWRWVPAP